MSGFYSQPFQMEPLLIDATRLAHQELLGLAQQLSEASAALDARLSPLTAQGMSALVMGMNCYYSNLLEGHQTLPIDIDAAIVHLKQNKGHRDLKNLAAAHIETDRWARACDLQSMPLTEFIKNAHATFYDNLPPESLLLVDGSSVVPGELRQQNQNVIVGQHVPPSAESLPAFMARYESVYGQRLATATRSGIYKLDAVMATFIAHHRLVWIHPFLDGNGRVARITLDAMLRACGVNSAGLWSMSRGFAKTNDTYKQRLAGADSPRMGDLDGRGNLSEKRLVEFCRYAMTTAIDQANFMAKLFDVKHLIERVDTYFQVVRRDLRPESACLYVHAILTGEFERMAASLVTGLPERTARKTLAALVSEGFLVSDTPRSRVRAGFPVMAMGSIFPNLFPMGMVN